MTDIRYLHVHVTAHVDGDAGIEISESVAIPPTYTERDVAALTARQVEDAAFRLNRQTFGRAPARDALIAAAARLRALQELVDGLDPGALRDALQAIFDLTNAEATALYDDDPEG